ncbi:MAG: hypothetical protein CFE23_03205 [Flavobacterium sp. BFFFF1]|uniref:DUF5004 domain-containing protein n=1 Tax=unclassified Flavobacterium TaxID=196869 RepID=UPI000BDCD05F|nr:MULTISPECIES: DUF5004 domain-containing protein [unclassified Flavobacterium]OYU81896.1 MAG: hypothetical protein CFE23_03205 [Flavobacterium sp. BFFFF1]
MKIRVFILSTVSLLFLTSATPVKQNGIGISEKLIGTWTWTTFISAETKQELSMEAFTQMQVKEMKTEFRSDNTYIESKLKKGNKDYITVNGEWKVENEEILSLKEKANWTPAKILKFANDSLLLQMNPKIVLLMVKQK